MCIKQYQAHAYCKHPDKLTAIGDDWTQHVVIDPCRDAYLASRHARRRDSEVECEDAAWEAVIDPLLEVYCEDCLDDDSRWSAINMRADFETHRDRWEYTGILDESELNLIQGEINSAIREHEDEANSGPYNNSYYVLKEALQKFIAQWDQYVEVKQATMEEEENERQEAEAWQLARIGSRVDEAMETSMYPPGYLAQAEALRAEASRAQDDSHHSRRHHKPNAMLSFLTGKRRPKK